MRLPDRAPRLTRRAVVASALAAAGTACRSMGREILDLPGPPADARLHYGPDALQFADLRLPPGPGPHPVAIVIHGGFWRAKYNLDHIGHLCAALAQAGIATWSLEYRRVGNPGGGWPGTFLDTALGADFVPPATLNQPADGSISTSSPTPGADRSADVSDVGPDAGTTTDRGGTQVGAQLALELVLPMQALVGHPRATAMGGRDDQDE